MALDKGKPVERQGRKASGLRVNHDSGAAELVSNGQIRCDSVLLRLLLLMAAEDSNHRLQSRRDHNRKRYQSGVRIDPALSAAPNDQALVKAQATVLPSRRWAQRDALRTSSIINGLRAAGLSGSAAAATTSGSK